MKHLLLSSTAAALFLTGPAMAQSLVERLASEYQSRGFTYVEVYEGPTQIKVEATRDGQTIEVIYDGATARVIEYEVDRADADDMRRRGVEFNRDNDDFTGDDDDDDRWDDDRSYDDDDDDDDRDDDRYDDRYDDDDDDYDDDDRDDDYDDDDSDDGDDDDDDDD